jgi:DNA invertase Pin-like site-specific DNA recombinase
VLVLGYVRVSSLEQEQGFGPEVQADAIRAYCEGAGLPAPELVHESESAESIIARVELKQILARAKAEQEQGGQAHIIIYRLDRLARQLLDQESVVMLALQHGFRIHSTYPAESDTLNPAYAGDPMRTAIRQFFGIFAQLERATIQARLDSGLHAKAKQGGSTGGVMPFGYYANQRDIAIHPQEAAAVRRAFDMHQRGLDLASIAALCAREFPEQCGSWSKSTAKRILDRRDLYAHGLYRTRLGVEPVERPELIILKGAPPAMARIAAEIDWESFPDPVPMMTLTLLLNRPAAWVQKAITDKGLVVRWHKGRVVVPRESAQSLAKHARESNPTP